MNDSKSDAMLAVDSLSAWYGAARILYDLSFTVGRGEVVGLMGRNGAGKSTTLKAVMGLIAERQGRVRFNGGDISGLKPFEIARRGLGYTPEDRRIFSDLTVMENLDIGRQPEPDMDFGRLGRWPAHSFPCLVLRWEDLLERFRSCEIRVGHFRYVHRIPVFLRDLRRLPNPIAHTAAFPAGLPFSTRSRAARCRAS